MPGLVAFRRRWSVGSDDLVVPGVILFLIHIGWLIVLVVMLLLADFNRSISCGSLLWQHSVGYSVILLGSAVVDLAISTAAMRGGILEVEARTSVKYLIYIRLGIMLVELIWLVLAVIWLSIHYQDCPVEKAKNIVLGMVIFNSVVILSMMLTVWCVFDSAGRSWVKMKKYQRSMRESESRFQYKRSGNRTRNWRQRKVLRAYQDSWDHRCRLLFCCMQNSDRNKNSFTDIARLLSDFFRDLDVVPSDVVAGLILLRKFQKIEREAIVNEGKNDTYEYLSGVPVTSQTRFLPLGDTKYYQHFQSVIHYMQYALAAYGWPMFLISHSTIGMCQLCTKLRCTCLLCSCIESKDNSETILIEDNCCSCNFAVLRNLVSAGDVTIEYATYHVDVNETPFFVAIDYTRRKVVISIRGTLSMKDVITDLNAESETLPLSPPREDWLGHKGMVHAAVYIRDKLLSESILANALATGHKRTGENFGLVLVGHSLGAGTAAILAILLRQTHSDLQCFAYSPPGGLLSMPAVQYTKSFITSVVLGKDVVPRIGLHQMESLRADLINAIKRSKDPKWKTISCSIVCCGAEAMPTSAVELKADSSTMIEYQREKDTARVMPIHPSDSAIALTLHQPLYPPGSIIHVVRHHPTKTEQRYENKWRQVFNKHDPVYQALWANNTDFDEVLISPVMIQDHMPDKVLDALNKVLTSLGPAKPQRSLNNNNNTKATATDADHCKLLAGSTSSTSPPPHKICLETSFTSLNNSKISDNTSMNSKHVPWEFASLVHNIPNSTVNSMHDGWFGLAPLATPESLSEVSSISSRTSSLGVAKSSFFERKKPYFYTPKCVTFADTVFEKCEIKGKKHRLRNSIYKRYKLEEKCVSNDNYVGWEKNEEIEHSDNSSNEQFFSATSIEGKELSEDQSLLNRDISSNETSPLVSSLHLLTDERFMSLLQGSVLRDDSISSGSFKSVCSEPIEGAINTSIDSFTINADVHRTDEKQPCIEENSLLKDIEVSLNMTSEGLHYSFADGVMTVKEKNSLNQTESDNEGNHECSKSKTKKTYQMHL